MFKQRKDVHLNKNRTGHSNKSKTLKRHITTRNSHNVSQKNKSSIYKHQNIIKNNIKQHLFFSTQSANETPSQKVEQATKPPPSITLIPECTVA